jgi:hypothetical protein
MQNIPRGVDVGVEDGLTVSWRSFREASQAKFCCGLSSATETGRVRSVRHKPLGLVAPAFCSSASSIVHLYDPSS